MEQKKASGLLVTTKTGHACHDKSKDKRVTSVIPAGQVTSPIRAQFVISNLW